MRLLLTIVLGLALVSPSLVAQEPAKNAQADLKWAQGVASDFLNAVGGGQLELAESLTSDAFRAAMAKSNKAGLRDWLSSNPATRSLKQREIKTAEISPSGNEVILVGKSKSASDKQHEFSVRLTKSRESGEWEVRYFNISDVAPPVVATRPLNTVTPKPYEYVLGKIPDDFIVCALSVKQAPKAADVQISEGEVTGLVDVVVNQPKKNVVLLVNTYNPTIWNIAHTPDTKIVGVVATGYHKQALLGLERGVKQAVSTHDEEAQFQYYRGSNSELSPSQQLQAFDRYAIQTLGKPISATGLRTTSGPYCIGEEPDPDTKLVQDKTKTVADLAIEGSLPPGEKGLALLVKEGKIRPATADEIDEWRELALARQPINADRRPGAYLRAENTYVMLKETPLPPGLAGGNSRSFLVPKGMAIHKPSKQHCSFYIMDGTEVGPGAP